VRVRGRIEGQDADGRAYAAAGEFGVVFLDAVFLVLVPVCTFFLGSAAFFLGAAAAFFLGAAAAFFLGSAAGAFFAFFFAGAGAGGSGSGASTVFGCSKSNAFWTSSNDPPSLATWNASGMPQISIPGIAAELAYAAAMFSTTAGVMQARCCDERKVVRVNV
jgi:hypothetical protein